MSSTELPSNTPPSTLINRGLSLMRMIIGGGGDAEMKRGALSAFAVRIVAALLAYVSHILFVRMIGAHEYGVFAYVWVWMMILAQVSQLGYGNAMVRFVSQYVVTKEFGHLRGAILTVNVIGLVASITIAGAGFAAVSMLGDRLAEPYVLPLLLILITVPVVTLEQVAEGISRGFGWVKTALVPIYILRPAAHLVFLGLALAIGMDASAETAVKAGIAAAVFALLVQNVLIYVRARRNYPRPQRKYALPLWTSVALPLVVVDSTGLINYYGDLIVLSFFVTPDQLAIYFAAAKTISMIALVHFAVAAVANQKFAALGALNNTEKLGEVIRTTTHWTFWPALMATAGLLTLGMPLLWLFGEDFLAGYPVMFILALGHLARAASGQAEAVLNMLGQQRKSALSVVVSLVTNIALNVLLIPHFGLLGAATATAISMTVQSVMISVFVRQKTGHDAWLWHPFLAQPKIAPAE